MASVDVKFGADTSNLQAGIQRAAAAVDGFGSRIASAAQTAGDSTNALTSSLNSAASSSQDVFSRVAAAMAAVPAVVSAGLGTVTAIATSVGMAAQHAADQLGDSVEAISRFAPVATAAGMSLQSFGDQFAKIDDKLRTGDATIQNALKALKIDPATFHAEEASQQIDTMINALNGLHDGYAKTAAAQALFGSSAAPLIAALDGSRDKLEALRTEADRTGITISEDLAEKIRGTQGILDQIGANFREAGEAVKGLAITVYQELKPAIDFLLQSFSDSVASIAHWIEGVNDATKAGGGLHNALMTVKEVLLEVSVGMSAFVATSIEGFTRLGPVVVQAFQDMRAAGTSIWADIGGTAQRFFEALVASATESLRAIGNEFVALGTTAKSAFTFDMQGIKDGFADLANSGANAANVTNAAWAKVLPPSASASVAAASADFKKLASDGADVVSHLAQNYTDAYTRIKKQFDMPIVAPKVTLPQAGNMPGTASSNNEAIRTAQAEAEAEVQAAQQAFKEKQSLLDFQLKAHQINDAQMTASTKDALQDELQDTLSAYDKELQTAGLTSAQIISIKAKEAKAIADNELEVQKLNQDAALKTVQSWQNAFNEINSAFTSQISGLVKGTTTFQQAFKNILSTMLTDVIKFCVEWALKQSETVAMNIIGINAQTAAQVTGAATGAAAQTSAGAASVAANLATITRSIMASASETFAGVFGFLSPVMGPAAAGPAAGAEATVASVASFATGSWQLPSNMIAQVHQGEMIVPARQTPWVQGMIANSGGGSGGGGDTHNHFSPTINLTANGRMTKDELKNHASTLVDILKAEHKRGSFIGYPRPI